MQFRRGGDTVKYRKLNLFVIILVIGTMVCTMAAPVRVYAEQEQEQEDENSDGWVLDFVKKKASDFYNGAKDVITGNNKEDTTEDDLHNEDNLLEDQKVEESNGFTSKSDTIWDGVIDEINNFADLIRVITNAYFAIGVMTCFLCMILNIVRYAAAPGNIFARQQFYYNLGATAVCTALLGAAKLLTNLILATCIGSQ